MWEAGMPNSSTRILAFSSVPTVAYNQRPETGLAG